VEKGCKKKKEHRKEVEDSMVEINRGQKKDVCKKGK